MLKNNESFILLQRRNKRRVIELSSQIGLYNPALSSSVVLKVGKVYDYDYLLRFKL